MSRLRVEIAELPAGWSQISGSGIYLVLGRTSHDPLVAQLRATLRADRGAGHDLLDDLLDVLLRVGVRALPDFVAVEDVDPVRLVVRGAPVAEVTVAGEIRPIVSGGAHTWVDVEVSGTVELVSLSLPPVEQTPAPDPEPEPDVVEAVPAAPSAIDALPSWPEEAPMLSIPMPRTTLAMDPHADDHDELPSYDDLFGSTQRAMAFRAEDEPAPAPRTAEIVQPAPPPQPPLQVASDMTLPAPTEGSAHEQPELPSQQPHDTARPAPGVLRLSTGEVVSLDRGVLLGRAPRVDGDPTGPGLPHVVRLASADNDISRNHAEVLLRESQVMVRDLGSTNGTTVTLPGHEPMRLRPNDQQVIDPGTVVALADEVSFTYENEA